MTIGVSISGQSCYQNILLHITKINFIKSVAVDYVSSIKSNLGQIDAPDVNDRILICTSIAWMFYFLIWSFVQFIVFGVFSLFSFNPHFSVVLDKYSWYGCLFARIFYGL